MRYEAVPLSEVSRMEVEMIAKNYLTRHETSSLKNVLNFAREVVRQAGIGNSVGSECKLASFSALSFSLHRALYPARRLSAGALVTEA